MIKKRADMPYKNISSNILLIEDNKTDIDLIEQAILKKGAKVHLVIVRDGQEALAYMKQWEQGSPIPLVVVLDLKLPKVDGLEVLRALKDHPRYKILPVIVFTSSEKASDMLQAYQLGANSYILKATDYDEFANAVVQIQHYWCDLNIYPQ
jgi:CheY-like chemotaxis protein